MYRQMLTNIDNVVFDLGGVVLDINRNQCVDKLIKAGLPHAAKLIDLYRQEGDFLALEEGKITAAQYFDSLREQCTRPNVKDREFEEALYSFIIGLPIERLKAIRHLRKSGKRTFVLSNTNPIIYNSVIDDLFRQESLAIGDYFDGIVASFIEKVCKPDHEIFHILLRRYNLDPQRTLFIDDSQKNIDAAEACGIKGGYLPKNTDFIDFLNLRDAIQRR